MNNRKLLGFSILALCAILLTVVFYLAGGWVLVAIELGALVFFCLVIYGLKLIGF